MRTSLNSFWKIILIVFANYVAVTFSVGNDYSGYQLYRVQLKTKAQTSDLRKLADEIQLDLWTPPSTKVTTDVYVSPEQNEKFSEFLKKHGLSGDAVQKIKSESKKTGTSGRAVTTTSQKTPGEMSWDDYYDLEGIYSWLDSLPTKYPDIAKVESIGNTLEGRPIKMITITKGSGPKPGIFINSLFHAREWITGATVTYFINELTANTKQTINADLISKYRFYIVPVVNPDGYAYSWTDNHDARLWRKNRNLNDGDKCLGVDLERNFDNHWGGVGSSNNKCSDVYRGPKACSELECEALVKFLLDHKDITDYYSFHCYGQIWMTPWSYDYKYAFNDQETKSIMRQAAKEIKKVNGISYITGASTDVYDPIAGAVEDWAMETAKINYSYCIELRDKGGYGFKLPPDLILPTAMEFWPGLVSSVQHIMDSTSEKTSQPEEGRNQRSSGIGRARDLQSPRSVVLLALILVHKYLGCRHFIP